MTCNRFAFLIVGLMVSAPALAADWQYVNPAEATQVAALPQAANVPAPYFSVTRDDVESAVAEQMKSQVTETKKIKATMDPGANVLYSADHPLKVTLQALQIDAKSHRWQAQAYIIGKRSTDTIQPVAGRFETIVAVPALTKQLGSTDVIEATDLSTRDVPERFLRKDTVTDAKTIIGKSPLRMISPNRPIRLNEVASPTVVKKGQAVQMTYTADGIHIRDAGEALEDGAMGAVIRVKNSKTGKAVTARVEGSGHVEVNTSGTM